MDDLLLIDRVDEQKDSTRSCIYIQGKLSAFKLLEDIVRLTGPKVHGETAIDAARYPLGLRQSPHFSKEYYTKDDINLIHREQWESLSASERAAYHPHDVIWVMNVPKFEFILHHWGNTCFDTDGCGLVGYSFGRMGANSAVLESRKAYINYYALVAPKIRLGHQYVTYRNSFN